MSARSRTPAPGGTGAPLARLHLLGSQWRADAENAFAGMAHSPERYVAAGHWVAARLEQLRTLPPGRAAGPPRAASTRRDGMADGESDDAVAAALLDAWDARDPAPSASGPLPLTAAERDALTVVAFAIRYAEVADWLAARHRRRAMADAVTAASTSPAGRPDWLVLDEAGDADGDPFIPYRRLEVDPVTGFGVIVQTRPDERFVTVVHEVRTIRVSRETGEIIFEEQFMGWEFKSSREREEKVAALRAGESPGGGGHES